VSGHEVRVCATSDVPDGEARRFDVDGHRLAVVHIGDGWWCIGDRCTHQDVSLAEGEVDVAALEIECWKHGSCFSLETGKPSALPATKATPTYEVRIHDDEVIVRVS
jgi:3-phenylpropionate/trans-cinnamate dioxygenase ferredoxin subunit